MAGCSLFILLCLFGFSTQKSTWDDDSYVGAVVEFEVNANSSQNLLKYIELIREAAEQDADIVVFPEMTLTVHQYITVPVNSLLKDYPIPALMPELYDELMVTLSSVARENEIYVVVNLEEKVNCTDGDVEGESCPEHKLYLFNTNVVFDRNGAVINRYRKINLFGEYKLTPAMTPDLGIFETDFGVTFGQFICFDLMFKVPSAQIVQKYNITDIIFSTMWFSELPYMTAIQIQQAYAHSMNVNFLGAGANNVRMGSAGSGIYSGKAGALVSIIPGVHRTELLVARVPKIPGQVDGSYPGQIYNDPSEEDNLYVVTDPALASHKSRLLTPGSQEFTLTDNDVICHFRIQLGERRGENAPFYRAFVHDGVNVYARRDLGTVGCLITSCKTTDVRSCVYYGFKEQGVDIQELDIKMIYYQHYNTTLQCNDIVYLPISIRSNMFPLKPANYTYKEYPIQNEDYAGTFSEIKRNDGPIQVTNKITSPQIDLISFGIWGRVSVKDGKVLTNFTKEDTEKYLHLEEVLYSKDKDRSYLIIVDGDKENVQKYIEFENSIYKTEEARSSVKDEVNDELK